MYIINNKHIFIAASTAIGPDAVGYNVDVLCSGDFKFFDASLNLKKKICWFIACPKMTCKKCRNRVSKQNVEIYCRNRVSKQNVEIWCRILL